MLLLDDADELPAIPEPSESELVTRLGSVRLEAIDAALISHARSRWLKVARIVSDALSSGGFAFDDDIVALHARRVGALVALGLLEGQGNLRRPRWSEVRLPQ
jgi:hypothetical protein